MKSKIRFGLFLMLYVVLALSASVQAASQPIGNSGWAFVVRSDLIEGGQVAWPYVYGVTGDAVTIQIDKTFTRPFSQDGFNYPIIIEFEKLSRNAVPKIVIHDERIINETDREWTDYHMFLVVDTLAPEAGFNPNFLPNGDQLENVSYDLFHQGYGDSPIQLNFNDADASGVPFSPPGENWFQPGYYGGQIVIETNPDMPLNGHFGLKEIPTIPEPATLVLLSLGTLSLLRRKHKA